MLFGRCEGLLVRVGSRHINCPGCTDFIIIANNNHMLLE